MTSFGNPVLTWNSRNERAIKDGPCYFQHHSMSKTSLENVLDIPKWPRDTAVVDFQIAARHDCLSKHLNMLSVSQNPQCKLWVFNEEMDAIHLALCLALSCGSMWRRYWEARHKTCDFQTIKWTYISFVSRYLSLFSVPCFFFVVFL
ncbi:hypothetical protein TNCV_2731191 [Trichonephila clavipes]|nr:hypothetical protein TNCV_2731191 [Trichonephila clavipes]